MRQHPDFGIEVIPAEGRVILAVTGELDLASAPRLRATLAEVRESDFGHIVLDLRELTFMDSTGLQLLFDEHRTAVSNNHTFSVVHADGPIRRVIELSGLAETFPADVTPSESQSDHRHPSR